MPSGRQMSKLYGCLPGKDAGAYGSKTGTQRGLSALPEVMLKAFKWTGRRDREERGERGSSAQGSQTLKKIFKKRKEKMYEKEDSKDDASGSGSLFADSLRGKRRKPGGRGNRRNQPCIGGKGNGAEEDLVPQKAEC